jgi:spoIIIJ-associated protein
VEEDRNLQVANTVTSDLLERMKVRARVTSHYAEAEDSSSQRTIIVDIQGDDLSILIGRRSETLNALQYITSLIVGKELGQWVPLLIDVQGYRSRRERQLRQLARRMAEQAVLTGRRQVLEPMPANERRVIHLELRDHPQVATESVGEEPGRKVTIFIKK